MKKLLASLVMVAILSGCQAETPKETINYPLETFKIEQKLSETAEKERKLKEIEANKKKMEAIKLEKVRKAQEKAKMVASRSKGIPSGYTSSDLVWLARIVSAEAKGESQEGQIAVANVVLNRVASGRFPDSIREVIFQKNQFSPTMNGSIHDEPTQEALESARLALQGERVVPSDVLFFYNRKVAGSSWLDGRRPYTTIGSHTFTK